MRSCLEVNLTALSENIKKLSILMNSKDSFFCPMIKADGYGHGALAIAQQLQSMGIKKLGVLSVEEALQLKSLFSKVDIYIFGPFKKSQIPLIENHCLIPVLGQWEDLKNLALCKKKITVHIKFNLGMNRLGFLESEIPSLIKFIQKNSSIKLTGICSHLNDGESAASEDLNQTARQISVFKDIYYQFSTIFSDYNIQSHLLGSAAGLALWSHSKLDSMLGFRPGICLYGIKPPVVFYSTEAQIKYNSLSLKNVSTLKSFVVQIQNVSKNQAVSYGNTWIAKKKSVLAVVSMGYADGLPYQLSNKAEVLFRGKRVPIVGRICMDFFIIDITSVIDNQLDCKSEEVVIFGQQKNSVISIEEQSKKADTICYELLTGIGNRVQRIFLSGV